ncbi:MAG: inositol monophosphatase [Bacteroidales bacterium]|nr:inositol monophosphatase [Bacteroidales bacterium]
MLQQLIDIVKEASALMEREGFTVEQKDGIENIVTSSDIAVQDFLTARLAELLPGCGFLCEEEDFRDLSEEDVWIIDPIDGTTNYSRGIPDCCISVALAHKGKLQLGVVYSPARDELYTAERGKGAFYNGSPIHASSRPFSEGLFCAALCTYRKEFAKACSDIVYDVYMQSNDTRRWGSAAIELCLLARGQVDLYFEMRLQPWDYAAAMLILHEAGGRIATWNGGTPSLVRPSLVIAANSPQSLGTLLAIIHLHLPDGVPYKD